MITNKSATGMLVAILGASGCATGLAATSQSSQLAIDGSREFQRTYDQQLRDDPVSFLTTVSAHYLAPGEALTAPVGSAIELAFEATAEALFVTQGTERRPFEDHATIEVDARYSISISRQELDWRVLIHDRDAPQRTSFPGVTWFPIDAGLIIAAHYRARSPREPMLLQTSRGVSKTLYVAGEADFELDGVHASLLVFAYAPEPQDGEPMLIPFRDATSGAETYAAGRYLEPEAPSSTTLLLDFNRATNPLCAYSEHYNCPMPPSFNVLPFPIEAGARTPH